MISHVCIYIIRQDIQMNMYNIQFFSLYTYTIHLSRTVCPLLLASLLLSQYRSPLSSISRSRLPFIQMYMYNIQLYTYTIHLSPTLCPLSPSSLDLTRLSPYLSISLAIYTKTYV